MILRKVKLIFLRQSSFLKKHSSQLVQHTTHTHTQVVGNVLGSLKKKTHFDTNLPPRKCFPLKSITPSFGAVKLINTLGRKPTPKMSPFSTSHPEGMSTETIGRRAELRMGRISSKGDRIGGLNENPKMASKMTSETCRTLWSSWMSLEGGTIGIFMFSHCF